MASNLEADIRAAVKNGFLYVSLGKSPSTGLWDCHYKITNTSTTHFTSDTDPVEAFRKALRSGAREVKAAPPPRKREMDDLL